MSIYIFHNAGLFCIQANFPFFCAGTQIYLKTHICSKHQTLKRKADVFLVSVIHIKIYSVVDIDPGIRSQIFWCDNKYWAKKKKYFALEILI